MIKHQLIRMKKPHLLAGRTLCRYDGERNVLRLGGGQIVVFLPGDFVGFRAVMPRSFIEENPHTWEPCDGIVADDDRTTFRL